MGILSVGNSVVGLERTRKPCCKMAANAASTNVEANVDLLEEDDEFEEFQQQEWTAADEDAEDKTMWQDGWEDDEDDDNFTRQLRSELEKADAAAPAAATAGANAM